jgi:acetyl esterase/lipase
MLDDRQCTPSSRLEGLAVWSAESNAFGWRSYLGDRYGTDDVPATAAPARATDLSGLPPAFIDVGSADSFRDEDVDDAIRIWRAGGIAELHVWPGGFHGFDGMVPTAGISTAAVAARANWLRRLLAP